MTERILIVDADDSLSESLKFMLAAESVHVLAASSAEAALECIETTRVNLVLCELRMPGLDDLDLLPQIARRLSGAPIILTSECSREELAASARAVVEAC